MDERIKRAVLEAAAKSPCDKRKVGAVIVDVHGTIIANGCNTPEKHQRCEDDYGKTLPSVTHAEVNAIMNIRNMVCAKPLTMYVSHQPCQNCAKAIFDTGIDTVEIVESFMKFDTGKLRYDLIPVSSMKGLAKVLTYGAKKYKPNNWKNVEELDRYIAALYRHLEAWRDGEKKDEESGLKHLEHALTNVAFLLELDSDDLGPDEVVRD